MLNIELTRLPKRTLVINSRIIAQELEIPHKDFTHIVEKFKFKIQRTFGRLEVRLLKSDKVFPNRRSEKCYLLNEEQTMFYVAITNSLADIDELSIRLNQVFSEAKNNLLK